MCCWGLVRARPAAIAQPLTSPPPKQRQTPPCPLSWRTWRAAVGELLEGPCCAARAWRLAQLGAQACRSIYGA